MKSRPWNSRKRRNLHGLAWICLISYLGPGVYAFLRLPKQGRPERWCRTAGPVCGQHIRDASWITCRRFRQPPVPGKGAAEESPMYPPCIHDVSRMHRAECIADVSPMQPFVRPTFGSALFGGQPGLPLRGRREERSEASRQALLGTEEETPPLRGIFRCGGVAGRTNRILQAAADRGKSDIG